MGKGANSNANVLQNYRWKEIETHKSVSDCWIVIEGHIYDVSRWQKKHPGGAKILGHFAGQDATEVWRAMHKDKALVQKYMKTMLVGRVAEEKVQTSKLQLQQDFEELRQTAEKSGMFETQPMFYIFHLAHIILLEIAACLFLRYMGVSPFNFLVTSLILATAQAQAGWSQHDYGHRSVFKSTRWNSAAHYFIIGFIKGVSSHWWNFRHNQHHAKTNIFKKDPDVTLPYVFLLGKSMPKEWGSQKRGFMPYQSQHNYFWLFGPATLLPVYFHLEVLYFTFKRRDWFELSLMLLFFARFFMMFGSVLGGWPTFGLYMLARFFESFWFTFVTQMSHIPMEIEKDQEHDWVTSQSITTCNVTSGWFNDWFTGHLNYQIEHHLFPTMPRHNFHKVAPLVQSLLKKHDLPYTCKPLLTAFGDILGSLKDSGRLWYEAYYEDL